MKYIIEIEKKPLCVFDKDTQTYFPRLWRVKGFNSLVFDEEGLSRLEELNSDYINEHFGELQDQAYHKGLEEGKKATWGLVADASSAEYQRGLNDAWEVARKIVCDEKLDWNTLLHLFNRGNFTGIFGDFSAAEAIEKLKAYEEKQKADDEIKVGDEVEVLNSGSKYLIAWFAGKSLCGFAHDGVTCHLQPSDVRKTGRHFDIDKILEEMKK